MAAKESAAKLKISFAAQENRFFNIFQPLSGHFGTVLPNLTTEGLNLFLATR
jgi:hypothetical protein